MSFADVLLWMVGASWLLVAFVGVKRARAGDGSVLRYLAVVMIVAVVAFVVLPQAAPWILGALWLVTLVIPGLLQRRLVTLLLARRFGAALAMARVVGLCQPVGPAAVFARLARYQCLCELGRDDAAARMQAGFAHLPAAPRAQLAAYRLASTQQWADLLAGFPAGSVPGIQLLRLRARAETGDLAALVEELPAAIAELEAHPGQQRQVLAMALAFAGHEALVVCLLAEASPVLSGFWQATAAWAAGDESRARDLLARIRDPQQPVLAAAIDWRLANPPAAATTLDPGLRQRFAGFAVAAERLVARRHRRPWLTWTILAICVAVFAVIASSANPRAALWEAGAFDSRLGWSGNRWRFVASAYLHLDVVHLGMNGLALLVLGPAVEGALRPWRFLVLYLGAAIGGMALVQLVATVPTVVVGASASIMGLIGADLVRIIRDRLPGEPWSRHPKVRSMGILLAIQVLFDLSHPHVSQAGHIGGFLAGVLLGLVLAPGRSVPAARG